MHNARTDRASGTRYVQALHAWQLNNRLNLRPPERAALLTVMENLPAVEAWRATLNPLRRARMSHPTTVLHNHREAIRPPLEHVIPRVVRSSP